MQSPEREGIRKVDRAKEVGHRTEEGKRERDRRQEKDKQYHPWKPRKVVGPMDGKVHFLQPLTVHANAQGSRCHSLLPREGVQYLHG